MTLFVGFQLSTDIGTGQDDIDLTEDDVGGGADSVAGESIDNSCTLYLHADFALRIHPRGEKY